MGRPYDAQLSHAGPDRAAGQLLVAGNLAQGHRAPPGAAGPATAATPRGIPARRRTGAATMACPVAAAAAGDKVFLGWSGAEAGSALLACDLQGNVQWKNSRQGMAGAEFVAADGDLVYAVNWGEENSNYIYRLHAADGSYASYPDNSPDIFLAQVFGEAPGTPTRVEGLAARDGKLYLSINVRRSKTNTVAVVDAKTRKLLNAWNVASPRHLYAVSDNVGLRRLQRHDRAGPRRNQWPDARGRPEPAQRDGHHRRQGGANLCRRRRP